MSDTECPYCGEGQEINHDDNYGYEEGVVFEQQCTDCDKYFTFTTYSAFYYNARKADCLNGSEHNYKATMTTPRRYTKMRCIDCDEERSLTEGEMQDILYP